MLVNRIMWKVFKFSIFITKFVEERIAELFCSHYIDYRRVFYTACSGDLPALFLSLSSLLVIISNNYGAPNAYLLASVLYIYFISSSIFFEKIANFLEIVLSTFKYFFALFYYYFLLIYSFFIFAFNFKWFSHLISMFLFLYISYFFISFLYLFFWLVDFFKKIL